VLLNEFIIKSGTDEADSLRIAAEIMSCIRTSLASSCITREELADCIFPKLPADSGHIDEFLSSDNPQYWQFALARTKLGISPLSIIEMWSGKPK
jgi:hypothetical protein